MEQNIKTTDGAEFKKAQPRQIQLLKKKEEEELWISEEELYTDGSSDEENVGKKKTRHRRGSDTQDKPPPASAKAIAESLQQDAISWRPKQGSIKLPSVDSLEKEK